MATIYKMATKTSTKRQKMPGYLSGWMSFCITKKLISGEFSVAATSKKGCQKGLQDLKMPQFPFFNVFGLAVHEFHVCGPHQVR